MAVDFTRMCDSYLDIELCVALVNIDSVAPQSFQLTKRA